MEMAFFYMLTKEQKKNLIEEVMRDLDKTKALGFLNFTGVSMKDLSQIRNLMKSSASKLRVVKKRLLKLALVKKGIDFDPEQFPDQAAALFLSSEVFDMASPMYKLIKSMKRGPEVLGIYEIEKKNFLTPAQFKVIAQLPSKETLLTQLVYILGLPIRSFMFVLEGRGKKLLN